MTFRTGRCSEGPSRGIFPQIRSKIKSKNAENRHVLHVSSNSNIGERLFIGYKLDPSSLETVTTLDQNSDIQGERHSRRETFKASLGRQSVEEIVKMMMSKSLPV